MECDAHIPSGLVIKTGEKALKMIWIRKNPNHGESDWRITENVRWKIKFSSGYSIKFTRAVACLRTGYIMPPKINNTKSCKSSQFNNINSKNIFMSNSW